MKIKIATLMMLAAAAGSAELRAFVNEGPGEFSVTGDFDGNGSIDLALVDRATGAFRIGYNNGAGGYNWADPRASGMENVDAVTVGRLLQTTRDSIAVTSVEGNRINLFDVPTVASAAVPVSAYTGGGIGPNFAVAIDIPGTGATPHHDLFGGTSQNNAPNPSRYVLLRNNAGAVTALSQVNYPVLSGGNRFVLETGGPDLAGAVAHLAATRELRVFLPGSNVVSQVAAISGLPAGTRYTVGKFAAGNFRHVLTYTPGQATFTSYLASRPAPPNYVLTSAGAHNLGAPLVQLVTLGGTTDRLAALFANGTARIYNFNGAAAPTLVQEIAPEPGEKITSVLPIGGQEFVAFSGNGQTSTHARRYTVNGGGYSAGPRVALPSISPLTLGANVFLFSSEPFVAPQPGLLRSVHAGDWTSDFAIVPGAPATFNAQVWEFVSPTGGLRNPTSMNLGPVAPATGYGLVNQYANSISIFSRAPAVGNEGVEISINPPAGEHKAAIKVVLSSPLAGAQLYYRTSPTAGWTQFTGPVTLFRTTSFQYYGMALSGARSRIHTAEYVFPISPSTQDSDRDGIPDYVEVGKGLDPNGGTDQDGDGFTDLNELVAGTNPLDELSVPTDAQRLEEKAAFDLMVGLQPMNGATGAASVSVPGVGGRVYDLSGSIFRAETNRTLSVPGVIDPGLPFTNIVVTGEPSLVAVGTDAHFDIVTASADKRIGRELIGLFEAPRPELPQVAYNFGGGALGAEANGWVAAAQALYNSLPREVLTGNLDVHDTLVALLFERKVGEVLLARGNPAGSNMTLFPFRPTDLGRTNPPLALVASLETRVDDTLPGYKLPAVLANLTSMVAGGTPVGMNHLKSLTEDIYRISSLSNNAAPAAYPSPVNVLRDFLATGTLQSNYLSARNVSIDLTAAFNAGNAALANISGRPTATVDLLVRADTFGASCTILDTEILPTSQIALVHPGGVQYRLLESFNLIPGTHIQVFGYTDADLSGCAADSAIEVISLALDTIPAESPVDTDGDLLLDALELLLFGSLGNDGMGDADGDGFSNLQEFLDGTDPEDGGAHGAAVVNLEPPVIELTEAEGGALVLNFEWPSEYIDEFVFLVQSTTELGEEFASEPLTPQGVGPNQYQFVLPNPGVGHKFYLLKLQVQ